MRGFWSFAPLALLVACDGDAEGTDTSEGGNETGDTNPDDSGDTGLPDLGPPGCINLEGVTGDFPTIAEAISAAPSGVTVNVCAGTYAEALVIDKAVNLAGEGWATTTLTPPEGANAIEIGATAAVSGFTVISTHHGVVIDAADGVSISEVAFPQTTDWAIRADDSRDLVISTCTFTAPGSGAIDLEGTGATVDSSVFTQPISFGISATSGSSLVATNNLFDQVASTHEGTKTPKKDVDGWAIYGSSSEITTGTNTITAGMYGAIKVEDGTLAMSGDLISGQPYGVFANNSTFVADGLEVYGATGQGIWASHGSVEMSLTNTVVALNGAGEGIVSCSNDYGDYDSFCGGVYLETAAAVIGDVSVSDYESFGMIVESSMGELDAPVTVSNLTLTNNGRWSMRMAYTDGSIDGLTITGHREPDTVNIDPCYTYFDQGDAALFYESTLAISNTSITENRGWGAIGLYADLSFTSSTIGANECAGIFGYESKLDITGSTFGYAEAYGSVYDLGGAINLVGNTFVDTDFPNSYSYDDGTGSIITTEYNSSSRDVVIDNSIDAYIADNTFEDGANSIDVYYVGATIENNTWSGYNGTLVGGYYGDPGAPVKVRHNTADLIGGTIVASWYGNVEVEDFVVGSTVAYESWNRSFRDGELISSYSYSYGQSAFRGYGYYYGYWSDTDGDGVSDTYTESGEQSVLKLEDIEIGSSYSNAVDGYDATLEIDGLEVGSSGGYGIYAYWNAYVPELQVSGATIGSTTSDAIYAASASTESGVIVIDGATIDVAGGSGVSITGFGDVSLSGVTIGDATSYGVYVSGEYSGYDYRTSTYISGVRSGETTLSEVLVTSATLDGISLNDGSATVSTSSATAGGGDGLALSDLTATVTGNTFTGNDSYGMYCYATVLSACASNDLTGNTAGTHDGCDDTCGE